jgi:hypothetical protein
MKFWILSRYRIRSLEQNEPDFLADDLIEAIHNSSTIVVTDGSILEQTITANEKLKYHYMFDGSKHRRISREGCLEENSLSHLLPGAHHKG